MQYKTINIRSAHRNQMIDITSEVRSFVRETGIGDGLLTIHVPHTTAAVTINENADPDVPHDILGYLSKLIPQHSGFRHMEGNSDAHIKSSLVGCTQQIFIRSGEPVLGTWQGVWFCEFDGPRNRRCVLGACEC